MTSLHEHEEEEEEDEEAEEEGGGTLTTSGSWFFFFFFFFFLKYTTLKHQPILLKALFYSMSGGGGFVGSSSINSTLGFDLHSSTTSGFMLCATAAAPENSGPASSSNSWIVFGNAPSAFGHKESSLSIWQG
jgi:hypothetical protein